MAGILKAIKGDFFFILALIACLLAVYFYLFFPANQKVCVNKKCFFVEMAINKAQWEKGLSGRNFLLASQGMFFVFDQEADYSFWMKNMKMPLDIIFIDKNLTVVAAIKNAQPCQGNYCPDIKTGEKILYVLEIKAGAAEKTGISEGQRVSLSLDK